MPTQSGGIPHPVTWLACFSNLIPLPWPYLYHIQQSAAPCYPRPPPSPPPPHKVPVLLKYIQLTQHIPEHRTSLVSLIDRSPVGPSHVRVYCHDVFDDHVGSWTRWSVFLLWAFFKRIGYVEGLEDGEEEERAAHEEDEGGRRHGAEADERLLRRGANDELDLIERACQPWCRRRIECGRKCSLPTWSHTQSCNWCGRSQSHSSFPQTASAPPSFTMTSSENLTLAHLSSQLMPWLLRICMPAKD